MIKALLEIKDPEAIFFSCLWKQKEEWRARYDFKHENGITRIYIDAEDANSCRALINFFLKFFKAYEIICNL